MDVFRGQRAQSEVDIIHLTFHRDSRTALLHSFNLSAHYRHYNEAIKQRQIREIFTEEICALRIIRKNF